MGAAMTLATSGVATDRGVSGGGADAVVDGGVWVDGEQPTSNATMTKTAAVVRLRMIGSYWSGSGSCRASGSGLNCGGCLTSSEVASGSMSFSVRNMKKNTTQPIAEMKIQLINR